MYSQAEAKRSSLQTLALTVSWFFPSFFFSNSIEVVYYRVHFLGGESEKGFVISDHMDSSPPKKRKIQNMIICHDSVQEQRRGKDTETSADIG